MVAVALRACDVTYCEGHGVWVDGSGELTEDRETHRRLGGARGGRVNQKQAVQNTR